MTAISQHLFWSLAALSSLLLLTEAAAQDQPDVGSPVPGFPACTLVNLDYGMAASCPCARGNGSPAVSFAPMPRPPVVIDPSQWAIEVNSANSDCAGRPLPFPRALPQ